MAYVDSEVLFEGRYLKGRKNLPFAFEISKTYN